ncbi:Galactosyl transferase GMA12/MNN10 family protein [Rhynchospora pubera]|uniref:Galactosyl transferase GMA12/MNN10 family protein n=1 Tax=Rhynchospora pubera TaxID=906938 RepID=A0AAV8FLH4_9POAL|nr:Galactosyl transferase GMA12/MNN10 family protein [Rhynchospora pubera]
MGLKNGSSRVSLPTSRDRVPRSRQQIQKTFSNVKLTILCGFVTILVLRGTIGLGSITGSAPASEDQKVMEDIDRILREIRSDSEPEAEDSFTLLYHGNSNNHNWTYAEAVEAMNFSLGPKISDWDHQRQLWLTENPHFPNQVSGKPRILLLTGSPPNPCDNSLGHHYLLKSTKNKIDYCRLLGIEIIHSMASFDKDFTGYWVKLPIIRRLMLSHPEVEWIWWMDSDAIFTDMAFELPLEKYKDHNLIIHGYPNLLFEEHSWIALNDGIFLIRNCQWSFDLMDAWATMGPKGIVRDLAGLVDKYEEMMAKYHPGLGDDRWPFITHFVGCKPCGLYGDYPIERCLNSMERAFNFADNQILRLYGFAHEDLLNPKVKRVQGQTTDPLWVKEKHDMTAKIVID